MKKIKVVSKMLHICFGMLFFCGMCIVHSVYADTVGLYEVFELSVTNNNSYENPFDFDEIELQAEFISPSGRHIEFFGFYDGNGSGGQSGNVWKLRFMPDETGAWTYTYSWTDGSSGGSGNFSVTEVTNPDNHGHVHRDPDHPRYLVYDDGSAHYWYGGCWMDSGSFSSSSRRTLTKAYIDYCAETKHNGLKFGEIAMFPMNNDRETFDLEWFHNMEGILEYGMERGIYFQIALFDTWGRAATGQTIATDSEDQLLDPWHATYLDETEHYIKYMIARLASYSSVYWELGNEVEHTPNSGSAFASLSNQYYIPWINQYDPYDLAIGLSEGTWQSTNMDIGFLHQTTQLPSTSWTKPTIMNELVDGSETSVALWEDAAIRDSTNRIAYRRTFWRMFTYGGSGSSEATWLFLDSFNQAVRNVMTDNQRLRQFLEALPVHINEMNTDTSFITSGPGSYRTRKKNGEAYVSYFLLNRGQSTSSGNVRFSLPTGTYSATWYDPKDGSYTSPVTITSTGSTTTLSYPSFMEDIVLKICKAVNSPTITTSSLPSGTAGTAYNQTLAVSGGTAPYTWSITSGSLPSGLSLNYSTGAISGTPSTAQTASFTVRVNDADSNYDTQDLSVTIIAPDTTPPTISSVSTSNVGLNSCTVNWTTNEASTSQVEYGTTTGYGLQTTLDSTLVTSHSVSVSGLTPDTTYHFRVRSKDDSENEGVSSDNTVRTAAPDTTAPLISAVSTQDIENDSFTVTWTTNEASTSQVEYGTTTGYGLQTTLDSALVTSHSVSVSGLNPDTAYHFRVKSKDGSNNEAVSSDNTATTDGYNDYTSPDATLVLMGDTPEEGTMTVNITMDPSDASSAELILTIYDPDNEGEGYISINGNGNIELPWGNYDSQVVTFDPITIDKDWLQQGTNTVLFTHVSTAGYEIRELVIRLSFEGGTVVTDTTAPSQVTDLNAATGSDEGEIDLNWTAPGDDGGSGTASGYIIRYNTLEINSEGRWDASTDINGEPVPAAAAAAQTMTVGGLTPGTQYYFAVKTQDEAGNISGLSNSDSAVAKQVIVIDTTAPYTTGHSPAKGAVDISPDSPIVVKVKDDGAGVDINSIVMRVEGQVVTPVITGTPAEYTLTYTPETEFETGQVVNIEIEASDLAQ